MTSSRLGVAIRPYSADDLWLLQRLLGDDAGMAHLGDPGRSASGKA